MPQCYVIAGSNGAGKTTFARTYLPKYVHCVEFINADLIAQGLSPFAPERAALAAGRIVLERIRDLTEARSDFAFETTLSGRSYAPLLEEMRGKGYQITLFYLWIPSPDLALERIRERVAEGGHNVPESDVRRRFGKSLRHFLGLYSELADTVILFDNSSEEPRVIAERTARGPFVVYDQAIFDLVTKESKT